MTLTAFWALSLATFDSQFAKIDSQFAQIDSQLAQSDSQLAQSVSQFSLCGPDLLASWRACYERCALS